MIIIIPIVVGAFGLLLALSLMSASARADELPNEVLRHLRLSRLGRRLADRRGRDRRRNAHAVAEDRRGATNRRLAQRRRNPTVEDPAPGLAPSPAGTAPVLGLPATDRSPAGGPLTAGGG